MRRRGNLVDVWLPIEIAAAPPSVMARETDVANDRIAWLLHRGAARDWPVMAGLRCFWPVRCFRPSWLGFLCTELPGILAQCCDVLSLRMIRIIQDRAWDWRRLDERIEGLSTDITRLVQLEPACARLKTVPGTRPITSSVMVAAIGTGDVFSKGRGFAAWLGQVPRQI